MRCKYIWNDLIKFYVNKFIDINIYNEREVLKDVF